ncbi:hypothetical protein WB66_23245 [bacteria symbiont BFo1 of Frankliniella occidentalis]|uniref:Conjugal transfer protein TraS n=1 Tax=Erwinia aphidicola TaxID=68334 RepID=A0ABU8DMA8_ERWAP|nr:hypothetical protein AI28_21895 [bacteria symbiont BFo1 of Frankliniella occidentalis]KYP82443.1 hypothetical protein WB66_23245 [bacteria symbiont BFo1 of Frankliniella occidentalis]
MKNLMTADVRADLTMLMERFSAQEMNIPSVSASLKLSAIIPFLAVFLSFVSASAVYFLGYNPEMSVRGFADYFLSDGWVFVVPTLIVGLVFSFMTYNNVMLYLAIPERVRDRSLVIQHLKKVAKRTIKIFLILMLVATILSGYSSWFAFSITGLLFAQLFIVNLVIGAEINRLGAGIVVEKISNLVSKI